MNTLLNPASAAGTPQVSRETLVHQLYEAAELEHNLMCTYLYAAFSLRSGTEEGLSAAEAEATARWRRWDSWWCSIARVCIASRRT